MKGSIKTRIGKKISAFALALTIVLGMGSMSVFAASSATGAVNGYTTRGTSTIKARSGGASTTYQSTGAVSVKSTYSYVNTNTLVADKITKSKGYYKSCSVSFTAPNGCRSVKVSSSHNVSAAGQSWTASTNKIFGD